MNGWCTDTEHRQVKGFKGQNKQIVHYSTIIATC